MDSSIKKIYNERYYKNNKNIVLEKAKKQIVCEFCKRTVSYSNYTNHKKTKICEKFSKLIFI